MKIAFLLTLYQYPEQANMFISQLLKYEGSYIFIHIDKKSLEMSKNLIKDERITIIPESLNIEWGDFSHTQSIIKLMKYAKQNNEFDYYSVHSGHDLAIHSVQKLADFLKIDNKYAYIECSQLPNNWDFNGGLGRIQLRWPKIFVKKLPRFSYLRYLRRIYGLAYEIGIIKGQRLPKDISFYGGSDWFTARYDAVDFMLDYLDKNPTFINLFENSLIGSEIFFNTLIKNSKTGENLSSFNNLRYIDWKNIEKGQSKGSPKTLKKSDLSNIFESGDFFARKFSIYEDSDVIEEILKKTT
jgi:hypothetical protein